MVNMMNMVMVVNSKIMGIAIIFIHIIYDRGPRLRIKHCRMLHYTMASITSSLRGHKGGPSLGRGHNSSSQAQARNNILVWAVSPVEVLKSYQSLSIFKAFKNLDLISS